MNENKRIFKGLLGDKEITIETGRLAKQADGSVLVTSGGTQVLVTACSAKAVNDSLDFFPLLVEYTEKFYAAGKFLGGFMKREGRPTTGETLIARQVDRPLRPLFPEGYMFETVISCTVLSYGADGDPEILASIGASAALSISDIPWNGPSASCKVGRIDGQWVVNPTHDQWVNSDLEITVAASKDAILMVEGEAKIVPEKEVLEAIFLAHDKIKDVIKVIEQMQKEVGKTKRPFSSVAPNKALIEGVTSKFSGDARSVLSIVPKLDRQNATAALVEKVAKAMEAAPTDFGLTATDSFKKKSGKAVEELLYNMMRADILDEEKRIGGRKLDVVREIETEVDLLTTPHGSALFTRGETQVLSTCTLGGSGGDQMADRISGQTYAKFYLHYNFPPFSVGEARGVRGVGRREQGHGNLAERALKVVMPSQEDFPYTTRLVCETLESNGSSSMGSVCSGTLALYDAGVPLKAPVAGIAMGLISDGKRFKILTDILGDEDHLGDMDFKVAGTKEGISAIQMDIKIAGLTREIMEKAIEQARAGRLHILNEMAKTTTAPRGEMKAGVPKVHTFNIPPDRIGALIGPGGKNIKAIQEEYKVSMEIEENGTVRVLGIDNEKIKKCIEFAELQINGPAMNKDYLATVMTIKEYGAFVDIVPGVSGLIHVSEISDDRINDVNDYLSEGDKISVRVVEIDRMGRLKLSAKVVKPIAKKVK
jgi:polyribonucleotide nucleotidyltransferase